MKTQKTNETNHVSSSEVSRLRQIEGRQKHIDFMEQLTERDRFLKKLRDVNDDRNFYVFLSSAGLIICVGAFVSLSLNMVVGKYANAAIMGIPILIGIAFFVVFLPQHQRKCDEKERLTEEAIRRRFI